MIEKIRRRLSVLPDFAFSFPAPSMLVATDNLPAAFELSSQQTLLIQESVMLIDGFAGIQPLIAEAQKNYALNRFDAALQQFREIFDLFQQDSLLRFTC
jgi:hypothetical protein